MSLLLEALKKAELAKQGSKTAGTQSAGLEFTASTSTPDTTVITRENLPNITQQLEILSEDLPSSAGLHAQAAADPPPRQEPVYTAPPSSKQEPVFAEEPVRDQAAAKQMFDAKGLEDYNPRKPFYYTVGALAVFAVGTIAYFWWQLQPRYIVAPTAVANAPARPAPISAPPASAAPAADPFANPGPGPGPGGEALGQAAPAGAPAAKTGTGPTAPAAAAAASVPTAAAPPSSAPPAAASSANSPVVISRSGPPPRERAAPAAPPARTRSAGAPRPTVLSAAARTDQQLERAYDAYQKGDLVTARENYLDSLKGDPLNRDALLGLAAIEARSGQLVQAEGRYIKLLEADPRDAHALAGLIALRGQADPVQSESRLKSLLASQPEAGFLHFALGNQMAMQARWPEAQAAYFKAVAAEPDNPDYAYNLAVSLDHIRQSKLALEYYQKALTLGGTRPSTFDRTRATTRIRELQQ